MISQSIYHSIQRYRTLQSHKIHALPIVILMPHSACNCRCVMCDIWKDNKNLKQLYEEDIKDLLGSLRKFGTKQILFSGGEALLNQNFFQLCAILKRQGLHLTLLSTGLTLKRNAEKLVDYIDDIIISLDGDEALHDAIRNIPGAFSKLKEGIEAIRSIEPSFRITGRTVIHKLNFHAWDKIIDAAEALGLDQISFLPADVSSQAFNRELPWDADRQHEVMLSIADLPLLQNMYTTITKKYKDEFQSRFIAESPAKLGNIYSHYAALHSIGDFATKKCNAPWVSAVIEADGAVRPCFFHNAIGNIRSSSLEKIVNSKEAILFRRQLDMDKNATCKKCVCYLNLPPRANPIAT